HLIGHLQRNKVARALDTFDVIQTIDSVALGEAVARHAAARGTRARVLVEVNVGGEASKSGIAGVGVPPLLERLRSLELDVEGLMTIPPVGSPESARPYFRQLRAL